MPSSSSSTSKTRWLVDGANLMGSRPDGWWNNPDKATRRWIEELDAYARATGDDVTVVFDRGLPDVAPGPHGAIELRYASRHGANDARGTSSTLLPRVDVPRPVALRTRPALPAAAPGHDLDRQLRVDAANSWMQHPVGFRINPVANRATLTNFWAVMTNKILIVTYWHTILAAIATAAFFVIGISAYHLLRRNEVDLFRKAASIAMVVAFIARASRWS